MGRNRGRQHASSNSTGMKDCHISRAKDYHSMFESPWWPVVVVIVTMAVRIRYVTLTENLWILHPDEIFQSVEVAFSEVYGYGFRPFEYLPAPENENVSAEKQTLSSGMFGLRSPLFPKVFEVVLSIAKAAGLDSNPFMICRIFNVVVTSLLPFAAYHFAMKLFQCHMIAFLSCALTAMQRHLAVFGTHTLINSFISPFIFWGLTMIIPDDESNQSTYSKAETQMLPNSSEAADQNGNVISAYPNNDHAPKAMETRGLLRSGGAFRICINMFQAGISSMSSSSTTAIGGFLLATISYARPDSLLVFSVVSVAFLFVKPMDLGTNIRQMSPALPGGALAVVLCVAYDMLWYGGMVISPLQWFKFNVYSGKSHKIFGYQKPSVYLNVFFERQTDILVNLFIFLAIIYCKIRFPDVMLRFRTFCAIFYTFVVVLLFYSVLGHKEVRFIHNGIVLFIILFAYAAHIAMGAVMKILNNSKLVDAILILLLSLYAYHSYTNFPSADDKNVHRWTHTAAKDSRDLNACLDWLRRRDDVTGVFIDESLYGTAGFTILKHDVPVTVMIHNEYFIYDFRNDITSGNIRVILNFTDLFHSSNEAYRMKLLSKDTTYNYVISTRTHVYALNSNFYFEKVFSFRHFHVFRRNFSPEQEDIIHRASEKGSVWT